MLLLLLLLPAVVLVVLLSSVSNVRNVALRCFARKCAISSCIRRRNRSYRSSASATICCREVTPFFDGCVDKEARACLRQRMAHWRHVRE